MDLLTATNNQKKEERAQAVAQAIQILKITGRSNEILSAVSDPWTIINSHQGGGNVSAKV